MNLLESAEIPQGAEAPEGWETRRARPLPERGAARCRRRKTAMRKEETIMRSKAWLSICLCILCLTGAAGAEVAFSGVVPRASRRR